MSDREEYLRELTPGLPPLQKVMLDLDMALTGNPPERAASQIHHYPETVEEWIREPGGNPIWYLSDGGDSRVVWITHTGKMNLTYNSTPPVVARWEQAAPQRKAAEDYINGEYQRLLSLPEDLATIDREIERQSQQASEWEDFLRQTERRARNLFEPRGAGGTGRYRRHKPTARALKGRTADQVVADLLGESQETVDGFVAINADGTFLGGQREFGVLMLRDANYLKRIARPDARVVPATLTLHDSGGAEVVDDLLAQ